MHLTFFNGCKWKNVPISVGQDDLLGTQVSNFQRESKPNRVSNHRIQSKRNEAKRALIDITKKNSSSNYSKIFPWCECGVECRNPKKKRDFLKTPCELNHLNTLFIVQFLASRVRSVDGEFER